MNNHYGGVKTKQQMADGYGICRKTFNKLLHNPLSFGRNMIDDLIKEEINFKDIRECIRSQTTEIVRR